MLEKPPASVFPRYFHVLPSLRSGGGTPASIPTLGSTALESAYCIALEMTRLQDFCTATAVLSRIAARSYSHC